MADVKDSIRIQVNFQAQLEAWLALALQKVQYNSSALGRFAFWFPGMQTCNAQNDLVKQYVMYMI